MAREFTIHGLPARQEKTETGAIRIILWSADRNEILEIVESMCGHWCYRMISTLVRHRLFCEVA